MRLASSISREAKRFDSLASKSWALLLLLLLPPLWLLMLPPLFLLLLPLLLLLPAPRASACFFTKATASCMGIPSST
jgi:hypothetical protein